MPYASVGGPASAAAPAAADSPAALAAAYTQLFSLNPDQANVLHHCASWFKRSGTASGSAASDDCGAELPATGVLGCSDGHAAPHVQTPVCLIHGPFGSGWWFDEWDVQHRDHIVRTIHDAQSSGAMHLKVGTTLHIVLYVFGSFLPACWPLAAPDAICVPFTLAAGKSSLLVALILMLVELGGGQPSRSAGGTGNEGTTGSGHDEGGEVDPDAMEEGAAGDGAAVGAACRSVASATGTKKRQAGGGGAVSAIRILVAAHTNVAVDRVLEGLQVRRCPSRRHRFGAGTAQKAHHFHNLSPVPSHPHRRLMALPGTITPTRSRPRALRSSCGWAACAACPRRC